MPAADDGVDERSALLAAVYSAAGGAEIEQVYVDPVSGVELRMRPSEWALREFDRLAAEQAALTAAAATAAATTTDARDTEAEPGADASEAEPLPRTRRRWRAAALVAAGVAVGLVAASGAQNVIEGLEPPARTGATGAVSYFGAAEPPTGDVLAIFDQTPPDVRTLPTEILAEFDAIDVQRIYDPSTNGGGYDIFAARKNRDLFCLVLLKSGEKYEANCGSAAQIAAEGLRLTAVVPPPRPVSLLADGPVPTETPWQVEAHWNRDGTFSLSGSPVGFTG
ncbi:hypothetical protein [Leifsonia sp. Leaf264]|uniref:hypothetical protein n=1 Tax=Leifsonia sp. Leaf264 TaxID=1736314 RepID=UPI000A4B67DB|nr:hypothetical protein [Leifsonia sp. Leaf264]